MGRILDSITSAVLGLHGPVAYLVIGVLAFGEAAAFLGLITPGEIAMILGGVLASEGRVDIEVMLAVAAVAAILGDTTGYWLGRRWGQQLTSWDPIARRFSDQIDRTEEYFRERGGRAIVVGRWASVVRTFIPFVAGTSGMSYRRFLLYSIPAAAGWAVAFVLVGFAAGQSWHVVEEYAGRASLILLLLVVIALLLRWGARAVAKRQDRIVEWGRRAASWPPVRWVRRRYGAQLRWVGDRFNPNVARGLGLTLGFGVLAVGATTIGILVTDVATFQGLARFDVPVQLWFADVSTDAAAQVAGWVVASFELPWLLVPTAVGAGYALWRANLRTAARTVAGTLGAAGIAWVVQGITPRQLTETEFPAVATAAAAALIFHAAAVASTRLEWGRAVRIVAVGMFLVSAIGVAVLVVEVAALTGTLFGAALGATWAAALEVQARLPFVGSTPAERSRRAGPERPPMPDSPPR
ncbi:MAG: DedA family protein [Actinobacteria bacterium]|nr:DedA family protein [Actinomycetota bacterium]